MKQVRADHYTDGSEIAVVGMAGRFPGARNVAEFWKNLREGVESITFFTDDELLAAGVDSATLRDPNYVKASGVLDEIDKFDAAFFGFSPRDAAIMDPQHRLFLECAWEALESAGYDSESYGGSIGVYGGSGMNAYMMYNLLSNPGLIASVGEFLIRHTGNDKDFLTTRVSYNLNLKGPSVNVQTACSTSLVAVHLACQSLLNGECDMALAGGVTVQIPQLRGYLYKEGEILSSDGHCRAFDARAGGTVFGSGVGIVVLKRLSDAISDGDCVYAVVKGSAVNNDGSVKVGYMAPSVDGQAQVVAEALAIAGVDPETISYIEAHGTGTPVGDPIEIAALTQAFAYGSGKKRFCAIGSLKTNIGHLDTAAGVAGFIKTVLALGHKLLPASLNYERPNPKIDFENGPFYVNTQLSEWTTKGVPRRAGVSSLGVGGTNAHVILEEAPRVDGSGRSRPWQLLVLSAKTTSALESATNNLAACLQRHPDANLADVAYTCHVGRRAFRHRRMLVCRNVIDARTALEKLDPKRVLTQSAGQSGPSVVFMFPGGGAQYPNMGLELYQEERVYREHVEESLRLVRPHLDADLLSLMYPEDNQIPEAAEALERPSIALPALFITEYALAKLWMSWGIEPVAMIGHSLGEYTAACLAGVISLEDALSLVALRGELFEKLPEGGMLSVPLSEQELRPVLGHELSIAAVNGPSQCVASGNTKAIRELETVLAARGLDSRRLRISVAAHSEMLAPILDEFAQRVATLKLRPPSVPYISNVTGTWVKKEDAQDASYWARHLRSTIRFADGIQELLKGSNRVLIEVGPGQTLSSLARKLCSAKAGQAVFPSLRHPQEHNTSDLQFLLNTLGRLWLAGKKVDWNRFYANERRCRVPLPTYPFERESYWIEPGKQAYKAIQAKQAPGAKRAGLAQWFYSPVWKRSALAAAAGPEDQEASSNWLVFTDAIGLGSQIVDRLARTGQHVVTVAVGERFTRVSEDLYTVNPDAKQDYDALIGDLIEQGIAPQRIIHLWSVTGPQSNRSKLECYDEDLRVNFYSLLFLAQALAKADLAQALHITIVSNSMQQIGGEAVRDPEKAVLLGPCRVIPQEFLNITCQSIDVALPRRSGWLAASKPAPQQKESLVDQLMAELCGRSSDQIVAYRGPDRWVQSFEAVRLDERVDLTDRLREKGVYLITGGLGGIGLALAEHLAKTARARVVLTGRTAPPERDEWDKWLGSHDSADPTSRKIRKVQALEKLGAEVLVHRADVSSLDQMQSVIRLAGERFGKINGVIHAAGILNDGIIQLKTPEAAATVLAPKVKGALVLAEVLKDTKLDFFAAFSSTSSILGPAGQVDYTAANAFLDAFARSKSSHDGSYTVAINWGVWQEVGMAAEAARQLRHKEAWQHAGAKEMAHPLLGKCIVDTPDEIVYSADYSVEKQWILSQHRITGGAALLPGTAYIELAKAALEKGSRPGTVEIRDLFFTEPLKVESNERKEIRITLKKNGEGFAFSVTSGLDFPENESVQWQEHARGEARYVDAVEPPVYALKDIADRCSLTEITFGDKEQETKQERFLCFGPRWKNVRWMKFGVDEALASLELREEFLADLEHYQVHPALLDLATGYALPLLKGYESCDDLYVPFSYKRVLIRGQLPRRIFSYVKSRKDNAVWKEAAAFDVLIMSEQGLVLVEIEELTVRRVPYKTALTLSRDYRLAAEPSSPNGNHVIQTPSDKNLLQLWLKEGILPDEGGRAFNLVLSSSTLPQIVVSPIDLQTLAEQIRATTSKSQRSTGVKPSRANLQNSYTAPRDEVEKDLARLWEELLGVDGVGITDDFFELGGHSLIAMRLFARIKKSHKVDLGLATLFEAPTIEQLADLLRKDGASAPWSSLVAMQPGGTKPILFCVHGVGGNVLGYNDLVRHLGPDQPVYALQAQSLNGTQAPLTRMEEIAAHYVKEIKTVQPEGPYYLAGYSFGGVAAFEMAQQLRAQGQQVALLVLFDTQRPGHVVGWSTKVRLHAHVLSQLGGRQKLTYLSTKLKKKVKSALGKHFVKGSQGAAQRSPRAIQDVRTINLRAFNSYIPQVYPGRVTLFRASELGESGIKDTQLGWGGMAAGGLEMYDVPGNHINMLYEPHVAAVAEKLRACIEKCRLATPDAGQPSPISANDLDGLSVKLGDAAYPLPDHLKDAPKIAEITP